MLDTGTGVAEISPSGHGITPVCRGDTLNLTCSMSERFLEWSFSLIPENETAPMRYTQNLQDSGPDHLQTFEERNGSATFLYSRSSAEGILPVTSTLSISPVSEDLNGTVVNCTNIVTADTVSTIIDVVIGNIKLYYK